jgi:hypothetical protein
LIRHWSIKQRNAAVVVNCRTASPPSTKKPTQV